MKKSKTSTITIKKSKNGQLVMKGTNLNLTREMIEAIMPKTIEPPLTQPAND
jgi:hypothetical protein